MSVGTEKIDNIWRLSIFSVPTDIGVSAGSTCGCGRFKTGLNFLANELEVHCEKGSENGVITNNDKIYLTNNQAIFINDNSMTIFE